MHTYCSKFIGEIDWASINLSNDNLTHDLERIIEYGLSGTASHGEASEVLNSLIHSERSNTNTEILPRRLGKILMPFFKHCPEEALNACYFQHSDSGYSSALRLVSVIFNERGDTAISAVPEETLINWCKLSPDDRFNFAAQTCKLLEESNPDGLGGKSLISISSTAKTILAHASNKKKIMEIFLERCRPTHWSGSRSVILRQRLQLLDQFNPDNVKELRTLIEEAKTRFSKIIEREEQQEQDGERSETASFE